MADVATSTPLPQQPAIAGGVLGGPPNGYENGAGGQGHMPPPSVPQLSIPPNHNNVLSALDTSLQGISGIMSPASASAQFMRRAAPEPNKRALYVGGLDPRVTEDVLKQIFETTGHVQNVKIIPDKNVSAVLTHASATQA